MPTAVPMRRVLVIDDNPAIHDDFRKILLADEPDDSLSGAASAFFGTEDSAPVRSKRLNVELDSAHQGEEGYDKVRQAVHEKRPYAVVFCDMRMPPGWDGLRTVEKLWEADPDLQVIICSAYSDKSWHEISQRLGTTDRLLILKKPFDSAEVAQLTVASIQKRRLVSQLELLVDERTEQLRCEAKLAQQASIAKSQFLANMSHEIRTPLTSIIGYANTFFTEDAGDNLTSDQKRAIDTIVQSGQHLAGLINGILDLSKLEAGKLVCKKATCSPAEIAREVHSTMLINAQSKNIELLIDVADDAPNKIESDVGRLKQVLINLAANAIKFTDEGHVRISVRRADALEVPCVEFEVEDTGVGISEDHLENVFEAFTQADESFTRNYGGTGLGLTVSRGLAKLLGGDISCESELGSGSTFICTIPVGQPRTADVAPRANVEQASTSESDKVEQIGCRILLAEDNKLNQHFISVMLRKAGADVTCVDDGKAACNEVLSSAADGVPYDIVLMDMQMPVMDGYTAVEFLREQDFTLPIIALTAHAMEGDREKCLSAGCDEYSTKPVNREELLRLIRTLTQPLRSRSVAEVESPTPSNGSLPTYTPHHAE